MRFAELASNLSVKEVAPAPVKCRSRKVQTTMLKQLWRLNTSTQMWHPMPDDALELTTVFALDEKGVVETKDYRLKGKQ